MKRLFLLSVIIVVIVSVIARQKAQQSHQLITGFPAIPEYPHAVLIDSYANDSKGMLFRANWKMSGTVPSVMKVYTRILQNDDWVIDVPPANSSASDLQYAEFNKGNIEQLLSRLQLSIVETSSNSVQIQVSFPASGEEEGEEE